MTINTNTIQSLLLPKVWSLLNNSPLARRQIHDSLPPASIGYSNDELAYANVIIESGSTRHEAILGWLISNMAKTGIIKRIGKKGSEYCLSNPTLWCPDFETYQKMKKSAQPKKTTKKYATPQIINAVITVFVAPEPTKFRNLTTPQIEELARKNYEGYFRNMQFHDSGYLPLADGEHYFAVFSAQPQS